MSIQLLITPVLQKVQKAPVALWIGLMFALPVGVGTVGLWLLNQMDLGECQSANLPTTPDSTRLYCAQSIAGEGSADDLVTAIRLADAIAFDHPLRTDGDRLIERWSARLLELGEKMFQEGKLNEAIALVEKIPLGTPIYESVKPRTEVWQATWKEAETIHDDAETALQEDKPTVALAEARKLLRIRNDYWSRVRFQDLANQIQATREAKKNTPQNQKQAGKPLAPKALTTNDLLSNWQKEQEAEATVHLAQAKQLAAAGNMKSLRNAVSAAELVFSGTPQYPQAQRLISEWNRQIESIEDRPYLNRATALASKGDIASLQSAISEANNIYFGRALYREAQSKIDDWTSQVRQLHDQQYSRPLSTTPTNQFRETDYRIPIAPTTP